MITKNIEIGKYNKEFIEEYNFLYDNRDNVAGYHEAVQAFDEFLSQQPDFIGEFVRYRGDSLSSDREAAAFMFAMEKYM